MVPLILVGIAAVIAAAFVISSGPPSGAVVLLRVRRAKLSVDKGSLRPMARQQIAEILSEAGVANGFIATTAADRVVFSRSIPDTFRQRLRNVLLNQ